MQTENGREGGEWSSLEAEFVWMADNRVGIHCESVENHSRVDEVLLHTLQASIELLKPHHLGSTCNGKAGWLADSWPSTGPTWRDPGDDPHRARKHPEDAVLAWPPGDFG